MSRTSLKKRQQPEGAFEAAREGGDFANMISEAFGTSGTLEGKVIKGKILAVEGDFAVVDVGLKSEGRIALREFGLAGQPGDVKAGDVIEVFLERMENRDGEVMLSREKAKREESWGLLQKSFEKAEQITGVIFGRVKGGFTVDLGGAMAFLPGSQVDIRPVRDIEPLMGTPQPFQILKMDRARSNIVVSRRAILEESRAEARGELVANLKEGQILQGIVKNLADYGAFVDLGGVDGLLHVTDIAWKRVNRPSEVLQIGQQIKVQVIRFNPENQRISLGMKQLEADPWQGLEAKYPTGAKLKGRVINITDYGAFVELEAGIEGLVHVSEMSWTKKNIHPGKLVAASQEVDIVVLDIDMQKRRISLGMKQCSENPWEKFQETHKVGQVLSGEIRNITEFGLFVGLTEDMDGMVHMSDISWDKSGEDAIKDYHKGQTIEFKITDIDAEKERINLSIKQLSKDPFESMVVSFKKGDVVTCTVSAVGDQGIDVKMGGDDEGFTGFIKRNDLSRERSEQRPDRFAIGEKVDAKITNIDKGSRKVILSIKAREVDEDKQALAEYGSSDSGASLGDILGAAIKKKKDKDEAQS